jgi:hypothetical protein
MNAEQCAHAFAVFMKMSCPEATVDVDYRVPTTTVFKEWAELLHPIGVAVNRSRLDLAAEMYYHHDDSPRGGYSWHGSIAQATFQEAEGTHVKYTIPLGLEVLADGKHKTMAAEGVKIMGPNLRKMCMVMSDAAALDVAEHMYKAKEELLAELEGVAFTVREREVNDTNFIAQCINHQPRRGQRKQSALRRNHPCFATHDYKVQLRHLDPTLVGNTPSCAPHSKLHRGIQPRNRRFR